MDIRSTLHYPKWGGGKVKNMKQPFITIGIASYNYARFLKRGFEAICRQEFKDYEILYCDDGSTDNSIEMIENFIRENPDKSIRLIKGENKGVISNKKRILDNAKGTYILLCDADDFMENDCLQQLAQVAKKTMADRVIGQYQMIDSTGKLLRICDTANPSSKWLHSLWHGCLYRREIFDKYPVSISKNFMSDDYYLIMHYNLHCSNAEFVYKTIYNNVIHGKNATTVQSINGDWKPVKNFEQILNYSYEHIYKNLQNKLDRQLVVYQITKFYYQALLTIAPVTNRKELLTSYRQLKQKFEKKFSGYLRNPLLTFQKENYDRKYGKKGIYLMSRLEKLHLLYIVLVVYRHMHFSFLLKGKTKRRHN